MVCGDCVDKLAYRLMANHKIDMIRAYELADRAVERVETRKAKKGCGCGSLLLDRWTDYYIAKHFSERHAKSLAQNLLKRVTRRLRKEDLQYEPMLLIERAGEGVLMLYREDTGFTKLKQNISHFLRLMAFQTNFKATVYWSFRFKHFTRIGRHLGAGTNPDYTLACDFGDCTPSDAGCTKKGAPCTLSTQCAGGVCTVSGTCGCPAPLPDSTNVSACTQSCIASGTCAKCIAKTECVPTCGTSICTLGTCGYNCIPPKVWNGVACVAAGISIPVAMHHYSHMTKIRRG